MSDPFLGQISVFGFNFAPYGWAQCLGQILPISQYSTLFSLLGTYYGGNGTSNFALPNMQGNVPVGSVPIGQGTGPGLQPYAIGETGGVTAVALTAAEGAAHSHSMMTNLVDATSNTAAGNVLAVPDDLTAPTPAMGNIYNPNPANVRLTSITGPAGGGQAHANMQPTLALNYCICLRGIFPERT
jgi:microcystin-dependent protein